MITANRSFIAAAAGITRGFQTLVRDREWWMTLIALTGSCLLLQLLMVTLLTVQGIDGLLRERTDLRLEIRPGATSAQMQEFFAELRNQSFAQDVTLVTKEQAYERARQRDPELMGFLEEHNVENPFRDTIGVLLKKLEDYDVLRAFIRQERWRTVVDPAFLSEVTNQEQQVLDLLQFTRTLTTLAYAIVIVVGGVLLLTIAELVRRRALARTSEVLIEKLVGAEPITMVMPFATEATLLLLFALGCSIVLTLGILQTVMTAAPALRDTGALAPFGGALQTLLSAQYPGFVALQLLLAPFIAFGSAWLGMRHELLDRTLEFRWR